MILLLLWFCVIHQIEPFFVSLSLLDIREGRKVSADFHVDLNHDAVRQMLGGSASGAQENGVCAPGEKKSVESHPSLELEQWLCFPKQVSNRMWLCLFRNRL